MTPQCYRTNCKEPPIAKCSWGPRDEQQAIVCATHGTELWKSCESRVNAGLIPWTNEPLEAAPCAERRQSDDATPAEKSTVAVGIVPNRSDHLLSLHVGGGYVLLTREEAWNLARELAAKSWDPKRSAGKGCGEEASAQGFKCVDGMCTEWCGQWFGCGLVKQTGGQS